MSPLLFNLDSDPRLAFELTKRLEAEAGQLNQRRFPDGETYLRIDSDCAGRSAVIFCNLFQPNDKIMPLIFLAETLRELGATQVGLVTPYLPYMRQDTRFQPGECVNARPFSKLLSSYVDYLVTLDPHLHRIHSLDEIYAIPNRVVHAAPIIAEWIRSNLKQPVLVGPDSESEQWVSDVARRANTPFLVLEKVRRGDRDVEISVPEVEQWRSHTPVLVDDIISSGETMLNTLEHLDNAGMTKAFCIGVHGIFADNAYRELLNRANVISTNAIPHPSNGIEIAAALVGALADFIER